MRLIFLALMLLAQSILGETALIVTIDQKHLGGFENTYKQMGVDKFKEVLRKAERLGVLGEVITKLIVELENGSSNVIEAWDTARAAWVAEHARGKYDQVHIVRGDKIRDDEHMKNIWALASNADVIDYISLVHEGDQMIKEQWAVPFGKLRAVYTEACKSGDGEKHFIKDNGAVFSVGHNANAEYPSASPFFSFMIMKLWFLGQGYKFALINAWYEGLSYFEVDEGFEMAQLIGGYQTKEQALEASRLFYSWNSDIDPGKINVNTLTQGVKREAMSKTAHLDLE